MCKIGAFCLRELLIFNYIRNRGVVFDASLLIGITIVAVVLREVNLKFIQQTSSNEWSRSFNSSSVNMPYDKYSEYYSILAVR